MEEASFTASSISESGLPAYNQCSITGVKYIFAEALYGTSMCEMVQKEADVEVIYLDPLNRGEYEADSYVEGMRNNLKLIEEVFR